MKRGPLLTVLTALACSVPSAPAVEHEYLPPPETGDGWPTARAADVGLDEASLAEMIDRLRDGSYTNVHSVLLVRNGRLILEEYLPGRTTAERVYVQWDRDTLHPMHSVTKSVNSALIGIAIEQGIIPGVDELVAGYFPEHASLFQDERKGGLTLRHLLTMSAGLEWDEHTYGYDDARNSHVQLSRSGDPIGFTLRLPTVAEPGQLFRYNSGLSMVLGEIVYRASGLKADAFAEQYLFGPLGIAEFTWWTYPDGTVQTGGGLALKPRDLARIGQLYLDGGRWQGQQVVSAGWVQESTTWTAPGTRYGFQWWGITLIRHESVFDLSDEVFESAAAVGRGGQWLLVHPQLDLVAVFTGGNDNRLSDQPLDILRRFVYPALR